MNDDHLTQDASPDRPLAVLVAQALYYTMGAIWFLLSLLTLVDIPAGQQVMAWILAVLMFGNGLVFILFGWLTGRQRRRILYLGLAFLALNILLTLTDEFGILDLLTLLVDLALVVLLLATRRLYRS